MNAIKLAADFVAALPRDRLSPETTEEREGFVHPTGIAGGRREDHRRADRARPRRREARASTWRCVRTGSPRRSGSRSRGRASTVARARRPYRNMREVIDRHPRVVAKPRRRAPRRRRAGARDHPRRHRRRPALRAWACRRRTSSPAVRSTTRCREWASVQDMAAAAATVVELARVWAEPEAVSTRS